MSLVLRPLSAYTFAVYHRGLFNWSLEDWDLLGSLAHTPLELANRLR